MANHTARLYAVALALVVFFVGWAAIAARPWAPTAAADPRLQALNVRAALLKQRAAFISQVTALRAKQPAAAAASPAVRVVNLPPLTVTRTS
ncbi:MAG TPA: hypothetical protein VKP14_00305 [Gaiellaceae bacterium]|nr:hypothetical protein [Gaiellaceae bacterium]